MEPISATSCTRKIDKLLAAPSTRAAIVIPDAGDILAADPRKRPLRGVNDRHGERAIPKGPVERDGDHTRV